MIAERVPHRTSLVHGKVRRTRGRGLTEARGLRNSAVFEQMERRGGRCSGSLLRGDRPLVEKSGDGSHSGKQRAGAGQVTPADLLGYVEDLPHAPCQPVREDSESGAQDRVRRGRPGQTEPRLEVAKIVSGGKRIRVGLKIPAESVGQRQPWRGSPLVLCEKSIGVIRKVKEGDVLPGRGNGRVPGSVVGRLGGGAGEKRPPEHHGAIGRTIRGG